eukprot:CAMPEP_0183353866 /NCGR_PEP_ID=MMETSP0164_2-20130417/35550_1 /TAXON_ID=221442 /ORGANISM="Coccolithus pelagicus ssp braarudi, Strain PLY182g" /LENGTH=45 /DNA_ID= /DNA_START= /DNA_END= /DNA_ORIENTATION=
MPPAASHATEFVIVSHDVGQIPDVGICGLSARHARKEVEDARSRK